MCTRNNAFSNRSQKGTITVLNSVAANTPKNDDGSYQVLPSASTVSYMGNSDTGGAYLSVGNNDTGFAGTRDALTTSDITLTAYGDSGYDTPWILVDPPNIELTSACVNLYQGLFLNIPFPFKALHSPTVYYKNNQSTTTLYSVSGASYSSTLVTIPLAGSVNPNQGGYYVVQLDVNQGAVAAIVICSVAVVVGVIFMYWKVRIQPFGSFQNWLRQKRAGLLGKGKTVDMPNNAAEGSTVGLTSAGATTV